MASNIVIKNIYYMLAYSFKELKRPEYQSLNSEDFDNMDNLLAEILRLGTSKLVKQGLYQEYHLIREESALIRGKVDILASAANRAQGHSKALITYDDMTTNHLLNQIIKTSLISLLTNPKVDSKRQRKIKRLLVYFGDIRTCSLETIQMSQIHFHQNNRHYGLLLHICRLIIERQIISEESGNKDLLGFDREGLERLFENFVLAYYKTHYTQRLKVHAPYLHWSFVEETNFNAFIPRMETDIVLESKDQALIIDTKFYQTIKSQTGKLRSDHLYQVLAYQNAYNQMTHKEVSAMLLYAQTSHEEMLTGWTRINGKRVGVEVIDLNQNFNAIQTKLNQLAMTLL